MASPNLIDSGYWWKKVMETHTNIQLRRLTEQREQLVKEMEGLRNKIAGLDIAIGLVGETSTSPATLPDHRKVHVTETIVALLREAGESGLKARTTIELAADRGISLNRGSVYSLLNRMTRNGTIVQENARYKLKEFAQRREAAAILLAAKPAYGASNH